MPEIALNPPPLSTHTGRRGSLGVLKPRTREGMQGLKKPPCKEWGILIPGTRDGRQGVPEKLNLQEALRQPAGLSSADLRNCSPLGQHTEQGRPALIASARAKCPRSQEKCEHVPLHHILTSDLSRATIARAKETKHNTRAHDGYLTRRRQHDSFCFRDCISGNDADFPSDRRCRHQCAQRR